MAIIDLTNGNTYTFAKVNGDATILDSSDNAHARKILRQGLTVTGSLLIKPSVDSEGITIRDNSPNDDILVRIYNSNDAGRISLYDTSIGGEVIRLNPSNDSFIDNQFDFGIGTQPATGVKLHVNSQNDDLVARFQSEDGNAYIEIQDDGATGKIGTTNSRLSMGQYNPDATSAGTKNLNLTYSTGNVGIGIGSPGAKLVVKDNVSNDTEIVIINSDNTNTAVRNLESRKNASATARIVSNGNFQSATNTYGSLSDSRIKTNIVDSPSQWDDIKAIQVKKYTRIDNPGQTEIGVIAQDLIASGMAGLTGDSTPTRDQIAANSELGELYVDGDDIPDGSGVGDIKTSVPIKEVKYSIINIKLLKAFQEAMERIESLEARIAVLENN